MRHTQLRRKGLELCLTVNSYSNILQVSSDSEDSRRLLATLFEKCIAGVVVIGDDFRIEYANDVACRMTDRSKSEVIGQDFRTFLDPQSVSRVQTHYTNRRNNAEAPEVYEALATSKEGQTRVLLIRTTTVTGLDGRIKTIAYSLDITEERQRLRELQESENRYQTLVESMSDGLGVIDAEGRVSYGNPALCRMTGYELSELQRLRVWDFFDGMPIDAVNAKICDRQQGREDHYETSIIKRNGDCRPVSLSAAPLYDSDGQFNGSMFIVSDITEQKKSHRELERAEKREREAKENGMTYLDVMAHDIGNQLQVLKLSAELLQTMNRGELGSTVLESVLQSVERCESIVSKARDIEHLMSLPLERVDLSEALFHCVHRAEVELDDVELETRVEDTETMVMADEFLERLFWIIVENAYVHNPGVDRRIWIDLRSESGGYTVSVTDNGPGIANGLKRTLFDPTRRPGGVGLHLARQIVRKYGGRLTFGDRVEGSPEQGADFRIWLPVAGRDEPVR